MPLRIAIFRNGIRERLPAALLRRAAETVLRGEAVAKATVRIILCTDEEIHELNRRYLQHDYPTDVLTFVLEDAPLEVELYIGVQQAHRQAQEYGVPVEEELVRLTVHGLLHALGYDDQTPAQQREMVARQENYVAQLCPRPAGPLS
jgi:probable rRNA maturation factor